MKIAPTKLHTVKIGATPLCERSYEVSMFGSQAILRLELWRGTMALIDLEGRRNVFSPLAENEIYPNRAPTLNFADAVLGKQPGGSPGKLSPSAAKIIGAAGEFTQTHRSKRIREITSLNGKEIDLAKPTAICRNL